MATITTTSEVESTTSLSVTETTTMLTPTPAMTSSLKGLKCRRTPGQVQVKLIYFLNTESSGLANLYSMLLKFKKASF